MVDEQDTLGKLLELREKLQRDLGRVEIAIQVIRGEDVPDEQGSPRSPEGSAPDRPMPTGPARRLEILPDTFFGQSQHQAARRYLKMLGHADHIENIVRAISQGGVSVGGAKPVETLRATMAQNTSVFVRIGPGTFGLREFYPNAAKAPETRKQPRGRAKKKATKKGKREGKEKLPKQQTIEGTEV